MIKDQAQLVEVLRMQAENALRMKPNLQDIKTVPPSGRSTGGTTVEPSKSKPVALGGYGEGELTDFPACPFDDAREGLQGDYVPP